MPEYLVSYQWWPWGKPAEMRANWTIFEAKDDDDARDSAKEKFRNPKPEDIAPTEYRVLDMWEVRKVPLE